MIIKGTQMWRGSQLNYQEMDAHIIQQMIGRAGRPQFDVEGIAVIMTKESTKV